VVIDNYIEAPSAPVTPVGGLSGLEELESQFANMAAPTPATKPVVAAPVAKTVVHSPTPAHAAAAAPAPTPAAAPTGPVVIKREAAPKQPGTFFIPSHHSRRFFQ
jgi:hypothetical protein